MTTQQFKQMRELLQEAIHLSPSPDFDKRANDFLNTVTWTPEEWELYYPTSPESPLNDYNGGPA